MQVLVAAGCTTSTAVYMDPGTNVGPGLATWQLTLRPTQQLFPNGQYSINNVGRSATAGCSTQLADAPCSAGAGVSMGVTGIP